MPALPLLILPCEAGEGDHAKHGGGGVACHNPLRLPRREKTGMSASMEELFGDPAYKGFVLQDKKRLPARFFARISGALTSRLRVGG